MANLSDAYGNMILRGDWTPSMIDNLNIIKEEWGSWDFATHVTDDFKSVDIEVPFNACGRWCYDNNLFHIGNWTKESKKEKVLNAYQRLCDELKSKIDENGDYTAYIEVNFSEEECGNDILRTCKSEIYLCTEDMIGQHLSGDMLMNNLTAKIIEENDYDYTNENLVELGFYESLEEIEKELEDCEN